MAGEEESSLNFGMNMQHATGKWQKAIKQTFRLDHWIFLVP
jgi:hypothetical protein